MKRTGGRARRTQDSPESEPSMWLPPKKSVGEGGVGLCSPRPDPRHSQVGWRPRLAWDSPRSGRHSGLPGPRSQVGSALGDTPTVNWREFTILRRGPTQEGPPRDHFLERKCLCPESSLVHWTWRLARCLSGNVVHRAPVAGQRYCSPSRENCPSSPVGLLWSPQAAKTRPVTRSLKGLHPDFHET